MDSLPKTLDIEINRAAELGNALLDQLRDLRAADPIYWSPQFQSWFVTGHAECLEGFSGELPLSNGRFTQLIVAPVPEEEREARIPYLMKTVPDWIVNMDAPAHTRLRKLMVKAFSKKIAEDQRDFARQAIAQAFARIEGQEVVEFVEDVARRVPGRVILRMLGLPDSLLPRLRDWSIALNTALGGQPVSADVVVHAEHKLLEMRELFLAEIEKRKANPREDFISQLVTARDNDDRMTDEEMLGTLYIVLIAGHDTTMNSMVLSVATLARFPWAGEFIRDNPDRMPDIIMEMMRHIAMSFSMVRTVKHDFMWRGHDLREGQFVFLCMAGANRDPAVFSNPDELDFNRSQEKNMTFAPGMHHCIGHLLAKMQMGEFLSAFCARYQPEMLDAKLNFGHSIGFRGVESLHVKLHPVAV
jgi:cytochrome P450